MPRGESKGRCERRRACFLPSRNDLLVKSLGREERSGDLWLTTLLEPRLGQVVKNMPPDTAI